VPYTVSTGVFLNIFLSELERAFGDANLAHTTLSFCCCVEVQHAWYHRSCPMFNMRWVPAKVDNNKESIRLTQICLLGHEQECDSCSVFVVGNACMLVVPLTPHRYVIFPRLWFPDNIFPPYCSYVIDTGCSRKSA